MLVALVPLAVALSIEAGSRLAKRIINRPRPVAVGGAIVVQNAPDHYRRQLATAITRGGPVSKWLVAQAAREAYDAGDGRMLYYLTRHFDLARPVEASETDGAVEPSEPGDTELESISASAIKSPLSGVSDEDWAEFCGRMRTREPGYRGERHIGQYEQHLGRLKKLGMSEPAPESEHESFGADIAAHDADGEALITRWCGDSIEIDGTEHPVCRSGILALLKSAGSKGAESWLSDPADRASHPKTTEAFLRANGCF